MKIRDLRPCDNCGKPIGMVFHAVRSTLAVVKQQSVREYVGLSLMLGGSGVLAEAMGAHQEDVVYLLAETEVDGKCGPGGTNSSFCGDCWAGPLNIASLSEKRSEAEDSPR